MLLLYISRIALLLAGGASRLHRFFLRDSQNTQEKKKLLNKRKLYLPSRFASIHYIYIYACDVTISHIYFGVRTAVTERIHSVTNKKKEAKKKKITFLSKSNRYI